MPLQTKRPQAPTPNSIVTTDANGKTVYKQDVPPTDIPSKAEINGKLLGKADWDGTYRAEDSLALIGADGKLSVTTISVADASVLKGSTDATATALEDSDKVVVNDAGTMKQVAMSDVFGYVSGKISNGGLSHYIIRDNTGTGNEKSITVTENAMVSGSMRNSASRIHVARDVTYLEIDTLSSQTWRIVLPRGADSNTFTVSLTENSGCIFYRESPTSNQWYAKGRGHCSEEYALSQVQATQSVMGGNINQKGIYIQGTGYSQASFYQRSNYVSITTSHTTKTRSQILIEPEMGVYLDLQKTSSTASTFSFKPILKPVVTGETFRISYKQFTSSSAATTATGIASGTEHSPINLTLGNTLGYHDSIEFMISSEKLNSSFSIYHIVLKFSVVSTAAVRYDVVSTRFF